MFRNKSIFSRYLISFIIAGFIPLIISAFLLFGFYEQNLLENTVDSVQYILDYLTGNITQVSDEFRNIISEITVSEEARELSAILHEEQLGPISENKAERKNELVREIEKKLIDANGYTKGAVFVDRNSKAIAETRISSIYNDSYNFSYSTLAHDIFDETLKSDFLPTRKAEYYNDDTNVITYIIRLTYTKDDISTVNGVILFDVYVEAYGKYFENMNKEKIGILYLADENGYCLYGINKNWIGRKIYEFETHKKSEMSEMGGVLRLFKTIKIPNTSWMLVSGINEKYLKDGVRSISTTTIVFILLGMITCLCLAFFSSSNFTRPIERILHSMEAARDGDLDAVVEMKRNDEIGKIADTFNDMLAQMKENIQRVYLLQIKQKEAEFMALKAQIQPHFLYNTLEVIRMSAIGNNDNNTAEMIGALAEQLRYIVDGKDDDVTLDDELKIINVYFKIIDVRYGGKIRLETHVDEEVRKMFVPKLSIQTLVENAVVHGLRESGGLLIIKCKKVGTANVIMITDTGKGMEPERLAEVRRALQDPEAEITRGKLSTGLGIKNTYDRLLLYYDKRLDFEIESVKNIGTSAKITIRGNEENV